MTTRPTHAQGERGPRTTRALQIKGQSNFKKEKEGSKAGSPAMGPEQLQTDLEQFKRALSDPSLNKFADARAKDAQGLATRWMAAWLQGKTSAKVICYIEQICNVEYKWQSPGVQTADTANRAAKMRAQAAKKKFKKSRTAELQRLGTTRTHLMFIYFHCTKLLHDTNLIFGVCGRAGNTCRRLRCRSFAFSTPQCLIIV